MKVIINTSFSGFSLSQKALSCISELKGCPEVDEDDLNRNDPDLIAVVEQLGPKSFGFGSVLKIVEIPDYVEFFIFNEDGSETIHEKHRIWQ